MSKTPTSLAIFEGLVGSEPTKLIVMRVQMKVTAPVVHSNMEVPDTVKSKTIDLRRFSDSVSLLSCPFKRRRTVLAAMMFLTVSPFRSRIRTKGSKEREMLHIHEKTTHPMEVK